MRSDEDATQTEARKMLAEIYERGQAQKKLRNPDAPEVGIFWVVDGKPLAFGDSLTTAEQWGEFKNYKEDHIHL